MTNHCPSLFRKFIVFIISSMKSQSAICNHPPNYLLVQCLALCCPSMSKFPVSKLYGAHNQVHVFSIPHSILPFTGPLPHPPHCGSVSLQYISISNIQRCCRDVLWATVCLFSHNWTYIFCVFQFRNFQMSATILYSVGVKRKASDIFSCPWIKKKKRFNFCLAVHSASLTFFDKYKSWALFWGSGTFKARSRSVGRLRGKGIGEDPLRES